MKFLEHLQLKPRNLNLYTEALTHASYAHENNTSHNERLEFLGDAVLELISSEYLYLNKSMSEGAMTKARSVLVCTDSLYKYATYLNLESDLLLGAGEINNLTNRKSILADAMEAVIAAIYLDLGFEITKRVVLQLFDENTVVFNDYKSILQELVQTTKKSVVYELETDDGPAHDKTFTVVAKIDNIIYGRGSASSKKEAEQLAAKVALTKQAK